MSVMTRTRLEMQKSRQSRRMALPVFQRAGSRPFSSAGLLHPAVSCACGGACPRCQAAGSLQPKLKTGAPDDPYEREADRVADQVMLPKGTSFGARMPEPKIQREEGQDEEGEEEIIQEKALSESITPLVQRQTQEDAKDEELVQAKIPGNARTATAPMLPPGLQSVQGNGAPLSARTRTFFESRMGHDFSGVRVHTGSNAAAAAQSINARAYTLGKNVVFNNGEYSPESHNGKQLLAHELTHVVQQQGTVRIQRQEMDPVVEQAAAFTINEIRNALQQGYVWGFEARLLNNLVYPRRGQVLHCRADQLWRLVRLLERVTNGGAGSGAVTWNPEFSSLRVRNAVAAMIGRDIWQPMDCGDIGYPHRYADYTGSRADRSFPEVRVPPAYETLTLAPAPDEHPEIEETLSAPLRNLIREVMEHPEDPRFRHYLVLAGQEERVEADRIRSREAEEGITRVLPAEGSGPVGYYNDASHIALSLVTSDPELLRELESLPDAEALRYLELLGTYLTRGALQLMERDPSFDREVDEAVERFREQLRRYRERHPPGERPSLFPELGNVG